MPVESLAPSLVSDAPPSKLDQFTENDNFTYEDVARLKLVSKQTVYEWVKRGMIPSPIYTGHTARFTRDQVNTILTERAEPGTYTPAPSPRAEVGKLGGPKKKKAKPKPKVTGKVPQGKKNVRKKDTRKKRTTPKGKP